MSYVRWSGPDGPWPYQSNVYIYDDVSGGCTCCGCWLRDGDNWRSDDDEFGAHPKMIEHVREHIKAGHVVPDFVIPRLEIAKNFN